ncbi:MAG: hypothetical protein ABWX73_02220 [Marmoricola sp.]
MSRPTPSATEVGEHPVERSLGEQLVRAIAAKDAGRLRSLFSTPVTFRGITPRRFWDAETAVEVVDEIMLGRWFDPGTTVTEVTSVETGTVADVHSVRFRMSLVLASGQAAVTEQTAYFGAADGRITDMRLVCSGFRPV